MRCDPGDIPEVSVSSCVKPLPWLILEGHDHERLCGAMENNFRRELRGSSAFSCVTLGKSSHLLMPPLSNGAVMNIIHLVGVL